MTVLYQNNLFTTVNRINDTELAAQVVLLGTGYEATAYLSAKAANFEIIEARWDVYRSPGGVANGSRSVPELTGVEAYLNAGKGLLAVTREHGELPKNLLAEGIRGIIQAETYLYKERGFASTEAYEASWKSHYAGSCRLYSNQERITRTWYEHVTNRAWGACLFNRSKNAIVRRLANSDWQVAGGFTDSFHEIGVELVLREGRVTACSGNFLRVPDPVCRETITFLDTLVGQPVAELTKQKLGKTAGGGQGCSHLVDLLDHVIGAIKGARLLGC